MNVKIKYQHPFFIAGIFVVLIIMCTHCMSSADEGKEKVTGFAFEEYAGDEKCASCHKDIYEQHLKTAHKLTSLQGLKENVHGSFDTGNSTYSYSKALEIAMEKRDSGLYQVIYFNNERKMEMRFHITVGSGTMGQSYIEKRGHRYYQMPVTYFTAAKQWSNSPGFPNDKVLTDRPITARCLECHTTYAEGWGGTAMEPVGFNSEKIILGVGCEKCHGPAAKHVEYQISHQSEKKAKFIINPAVLSRQQQLDVCALCHGGKIQKTKPSFTFTAGQNLSDYFDQKIIVDKAMASGEVEVHGNQYGLLTASKCFKKSNSLTCNTCHGSHQNERGNMQLYSSRCVSCHDTNAEGFKTITHVQSVNITQNCIDCHMPKQPSKAIAVYLQDKKEPVASLIRSHYIGIYSANNKPIKNEKK
jgi:nitrate/TMAO reductase-like tetraheme cytochrome c subunit